VQRTWEILVLEEEGMIGIIEEIETIEMTDKIQIREMKGLEIGNLAVALIEVHLVLLRAFVTIVKRIVIYHLSLLKEDLFIAGIVFQNTKRHFRRK
jgi:hypothetical protein